LIESLAEIHGAMAAPWIFAISSFDWKTVFASSQQGSPIRRLKAKNTHAQRAQRARWQYRRGLTVIAGGDAWVSKT